MMVTPRRLAPTRRTLALAAAASILATVASLAPTRARGESYTSAPEVARILRQRAAILQGCYKNALKDEAFLAGKLVFDLTLTPGKKGGQVAIVSDSLGHAGFAACVTRALERFPWPKVDATVTHRIPLAFAAGEERRYVVGSSSVKGVALAGGGGQAKVLVDRPSLGARAVSLTELQLGQASLPLTTAPAARLFVVVEGAVSVSGADPAFAAELAAGDTAFVPAGTAIAVKAKGKAPARLLLVITPAGAEAALAKGEVLGSKAAPAAKGKPAPASPIVRPLASAATSSLERGKGQARTVLDPATPGSERHGVSLWRLEQGGYVPGHNHSGHDELLYVLSGSVNLDVGIHPERTEIYASAGDVIFLPRSSEHLVKSLGGAELVQILAPSAPRP